VSAPSSESPGKTSVPGHETTGTKKKKMNRAYACDQCERKFAFERHLVKHKETDHQPSAAGKRSESQLSEVDDENDLIVEKVIKPQECLVCQKIFLDKGLYKRHISKHRSLACRFCGHQTNNYKALEKHYQITHYHGGDIKCSYCPVTFASMTYLKIHEKQHHMGNKNDPLKCPYCPKTFSAEKSEVDHLETFHGTQYMVSIVLDMCAHCPKKCFEVTSLFRSFIGGNSLKNDIVYKLPLGISLVLGYLNGVYFYKYFWVLFSRNSKILSIFRMLIIF
jgi:uncharacterized Zn-finger protein